MTNQPSNFNARSDHAARALKADLSRQLGKDIPSRQVQVDANGQPAPPLPPEGSYARMALEQQRQAQAQRPQLQDQPQAQQEDVRAPEPAPEARQPEPEQSSNAQRRFSELTQTLRQKDQELQAERAQRQALEAERAKELARLQAMEQQYQQLVGQNLEALDPETRQQVLMDARLKEVEVGVENRLMGKLTPVLTRLQQSATQGEYAKLSQKYQGFDPQVHPELIEIFRGENPHCTVEQAFKAVATPDELQGRQSDRAAAIPPIALPTGNGNAAPRYIPPPQAQENSKEAELSRLRERAFQLTHSAKPEDRREANKAVEELIRARIGQRMPQGSQRRG